MGRSLTLPVRPDESGDVVTYYDTHADMQAGASRPTVPHHSILQVFDDETQTNKLAWYRVAKGTATDPTLSLNFASPAYSVMTLTLKRAVD